MMLSVNILCWNNLDVLRLSIPQLLNEIGNGEIIVIDQNSTDGTKDFFLALTDHRIKYIYLNENIGISKGKNLGFNHSQGQYIFCLDGDVLPVRGSINKFIEYLEANPGVDGIGALPNKFLDHLGQEEKECYEIFNPQPHKCACLFYGLYRRKVIESVQMCEEGPFGKPGYGWEDHDFFKRLQNSGFVQYAADINNKNGRYYHKINSSIRVMGAKNFSTSFEERRKFFHEIWGQDA
jgi:glycosyltransferase involved in cell wall biosynthesis